MNWKLPPETEMEGFYESVRQGSRYHPYHKPENEIWHRKQQNGFNVNGMQQVTGPNQHHMWGRRGNGRVDYFPSRGSWDKNI